MRNHRLCTHIRDSHHLLLYIFLRRRRLSPHDLLPTNILVHLYSPTMANNHRRSFTSAFSLEEEFTDGALSSRSFTSRTTQYEDPPIDEEAIAAEEEALVDAGAQDGPEADGNNNDADNNNNDGGSIGEANGDDDSEGEDDDEDGDVGLAAVIIEANVSGNGKKNVCGDEGDNNKDDNADEEDEGEEDEDDKGGKKSEANEGSRKNNIYICEDETDLDEDKSEAPQVLMQAPIPVATKDVAMPADEEVAEPAPSPDDLSLYEESDHEDDSGKAAAHVDKKRRTE